MSLLIWLALGGFVTVAAVYKLFSLSNERLVEHVIEGGEVQSLVEAIERLREPSQPDAFNRAIRRIWDAYEREKTLPLIKALAQRHRESRIAQYWIEQVRTVEPELANQAFDREFLEACYQPEVAAACGPVG